MENFCLLICHLYLASCSRFWCCDKNLPSSSWFRH